MHNDRVSEEIERAAWHDLVQGTPENVRRDLEMEALSAGEALVLRCPGVASVLMNRVIGLGSRRPATPSDVDDVLAVFAAAGVERFFVHLEPTAAPAGLPQWLCERGLTRYPRGWIKLARHTAEPARAAVSEFSIAPATPARREEFGHVLATGFDLPDQLGPLFGSLIGRSGWHAFVALSGETVVGAASMFVRGGAAHLTGSATLPAYRGRGSQGALLARRIGVALALGCERVHAETGEAVPDRPNHSEHNLRRAGFRSTHVRPNYWPAPPDNET